MKGIKFNVKVYNDDDELISNDNYSSIGAIVKDYPNMTYHMIYYIVNYPDDGARHPRKKMGNIMKDSWPAIWDGDYAKSIRDGKFIPEDCNGCKFMSTCNGACHLSNK